MNAPGDAAMVSRLRMDLELKAEIIKSLRAERELAGERAREQAVLMAAVSSELQSRATALGLLLAERDAAAAQRAVEQLAAVSADLADYTASKTGELTLAREPVHLRQLLSRFENRAALELRVAAEVPERVMADQAALYKVLAYFIGHGLEVVGTSALVLEVASSAEASSPRDSADPSAWCRLRLTLRAPGADHERLSGSTPPAVPAVTRLRAALAQALCELMGASLTGETLILPLQCASDQAHTGMFRLAAADVSCATPITDFMPALADADGAIDLLYLDRQLGSLAPVILARTAPAFLAQAQQRMTGLNVAHDIEDLERLRAIARAWKGSALSVGARGLAGLLEAMEKQACAGRLPGPGPIWQVRSALDRVVRALESYREPSGGRRERA